MFRICSQWWVLGLVALAGCSKGVPIKDTDRLAAEKFVAAEQSPLPVKHLAMWYADGDPARMVCGEIEAPDALKDQRSRLRYVYFLDTPKPEGTIEMHEMVVANDVLGRQTILESRRIFDRTWEIACASAAPFSIGRWMRGTETAGDGGADTPVANAYVGDLLEKAR